MIIPNKFNGYSRDGVRLYNDPFSVIATIGTMGEAATMAETMAALTAAAAPAVEAAPVLAEAVAPVAEQAGIMQGAVNPPPTPSMPGMGTPMPPAEPLPPATDPGIAQAGNFGNVQPGDVTGASTAEQYGVMNPPEVAAPLVDAAPPIEPANPFNGPQPETLNGPPAPPPGASSGSPMFGDNPFGRGVDAAMKLAGEGYKAYRDAPMPLQALGALALNQKYLTNKPEGPAKYKGPHTNMAGFHPTRENTYLYGNTKQAADGGIMTSYANGGMAGGITGGAPVEQMSRQNAVGANTGYPMANQPAFGYGAYASAPQNPLSQNMLQPEGEQEKLDPYTGEPKFSDGGTTYEEDKAEAKAAERRKYYAQLMAPRTQDTGISHHTEGFGIVPRSRVQSVRSAGPAAHDELAAMMKKYGIKSALPKALDPQGSDTTVEAANGGIMHGLGGYSDGGRLLKGPGDGVSDSIPATIGHKQPARLADGEFVIPARIVSELGNGSTEAGARQLYAMMDRVQHGRKKSIGKGKVAVNSKAAKHLPA